MKEMAVQEKDTSFFLSCDDKATIDYGEPGHALSTGVRGRTSIVPLSSLLGALDHDVKNSGHIIPSVILNVDVPGWRYIGLFFRVHMVSKDQENTMFFSDGQEKSRNVRKYQEMTTNGQEMVRK